jgi:1,5-anhydro-D-fructose reductase (1,5-anhydro-D-mannitol-forming)
MQFKYASGVIGCGLWNFASAVSEDIIEITGTDGRITVSTFGDDPVQLIKPAREVQRFDLPNPPHVHQPLIQTIVDELGGRAARGTACPSTGRTAARTARIMDEALRSYYGRRDDDFWNRPDTWPGRRR